MTTHLIIPDSHAKPGVPNNRFRWVANLILERKPDVIINIGDMADMESLCSYDRKTKSFEGRRYKLDVNATRDAMRKLMTPLKEHNDWAKEQHRPKYKPKLIMTLGNHEHRINRVVEETPELDGTLNVDDLHYKKWGWEVYPYMEPVEIDGIFYSHCFGSGVMQRPIGGEHAAYSMIKKMFASCTAGHSHLYDYCERTDPNGRRLQGLVAGCYLEPGQWEGYAGQANKMWRNGITICNNVKDGTYDLEFISTEIMQSKYD